MLIKFWKAVKDYLEMILKNEQYDVTDSKVSTIIHKEKSNKMQQCINILLFHIYMKLNVFRATHRPSSGA
jgi:uncharacterized protein YehS (DUF1456 family)